MEAIVWKSGKLWRLMLRLLSVRVIADYIVVKAVSEAVVQKSDC